MASPDEVLRRADGERLEVPARFVDAVECKVKYLGIDAILLAQPVVFTRRWARAYEQAFASRDVVRSLVELARPATQHSVV